jgi:hypothetical protein
VHRLGKIKLSIHGALAVGLRRNFSNVAARGLGAVILEDISHQTVCRAELLCGGALQAVSQAFHHYHDNLALDADATYAMSSHSFASDATNSSVWRQSKLQGLCLTSTYIHHPEKIDEAIVLGRYVTRS